MTVKVLFCDGNSVKLLYNNNTPSADSLARFIVWRNECSYTETSVSIDNDCKVYKITVK